MKAIFPIEFHFGQQRYCGIVRLRQQHGLTQLKVRIMNARMDRLFYGHHIFNIINNKIARDEQAKGQAALLRQLIQHSIEENLQQVMQQNQSDC
jgi:hypothetical protein